jgi:hypothetical protein
MVYVEGQGIEADDLKKIRDDAFLVTASVEEMRAFVGSDEELEDAFDRAQADVFTGEKEESYVVIKIRR